MILPRPPSRSILDIRRPGWTSRSSSAGTRSGRGRDGAVELVGAFCDCRPGTRHCVLKSFSGSATERLVVLVKEMGQRRPQTGVRIRLIEVADLVGQVLQRTQSRGDHWL